MRAGGGAGGEIPQPGFQLTVEAGGRS
jgi:hypothetical protein